MATGNKLVSLQIVRALAAWTVVFHHYVQLYTGTNTESVIGSFFWNRGSLGVDVFFVLSGFVMCMMVQTSKKGPAIFIIDRVFRIAPTYWFYTAVLVACIYFFPRGFHFYQFNVETLVKSALFLPSVNPSGIGVFPVLTVGWTLNFEMFFYVVLACFMVLSRRWALLIFLVLFPLFPFAYPEGAPLSVIARDHRLNEFWAGAALAAVWSGGLAIKVRDFPIPSLIVGLASLLWGVALLLGGSPLMFALSIVAFALVCEQHLPRESFLVRALAHLGDISYSTYLAHCIAIGIAMQFFEKTPVTSDQLPALLTTILGTYVLSRMSYRWLENSTHLAALRSRLITLISRNADAQPRVAG